MCAAEIFLLANFKTEKEAFVDGQGTTSLRSELWLKEEVGRGPHVAEVGGNVTIGKRETTTN